MSLALGTLVLFLILIPGISFRRGYFYGSLTKKLSGFSAFDEFIQAIIPGVFWQLVAAYFVNSFHVAGYCVDFNYVGELIVGDKPSVEVFKNIGAFLGPIIFYNCSLAILTAIFGYIIKKFIRRWHIDHRFAFFRFNNEWFYILQGEASLFFETCKSYKEFRQKLIYFKEAKMRTVNAVVRSHKNECYIYSGILHTFNLARDGSLESVVLKAGIRRLFFNTNSEAQSNAFYAFTTELVVLKNSHIITMSVKLEKEEDQAKLSLTKLKSERNDMASPLRNDAAPKSLSLEEFLRTYKFPDKNSNAADNKNNKK